MRIIYRIQGMFYGIMILILGLFEAVLIYGDIASDNNTFLTDDNFEEIQEEFINKVENG